MDVAENGEIAVEKIKLATYDLILMDMQMPVMDGYAATKSIRDWENKRGAASTPVVALSAYALKEEVQKSLDAGCVTHITKPIERESLLNTILKHAQEIPI